MTERPGPSGSPSEPFTVVHVIKGLGPGGAEHLILNQLSSSTADDIGYRVVSLLAHKDHLVDQLRTFGADVTVLGKTFTWPHALRQALRGADVVHAHSPLLAGVVRLLARTLRPRPVVVTTEHNRWPRHHRATRMLNRTTMALDDATIAVSADVRTSMDERHRSSVEVVRHGIDRANLRPDPGVRSTQRDALGIGTAFCVGIVANFRPEKAYDTFVAAAALALDEYEGLCFVVVGQGPGEADVRADIARRGLGNRITLTGFRPDATTVMQAFDCFTLSSRHEGLPVSLMEAMTLGIPVVATRAGGIPEAVVDGVEGRLVPIDDATALAAAWIELATRPDTAAAMGQAAVSASAAFDAARSTSEIESLYRRLITGSASGVANPAARS